MVTVYVFHEPSLLSSLQDNGLTAVMLKALVVKEVGFVVLHFTYNVHVCVLVVAVIIKQY